MRKNIATVLFLILISAGQLSVRAQSEPSLATIRREVSVINKNLKTYSKKTKDVEGVSLEGTRATYYTAGGSIKKINASVYGESFRAAAEIYYRGGKLIFIYYKLSRYDVPLGAGRAPKIVRTEQWRVYYANNEIIKMLLGTKELAAESELFQEIKQQTASAADALLAAY